VELIIGIGIAAIVAGSVVGALVLSVRTNKYSIESKAASSLGQEILDQTKSLSEGDWVGLYSVSDKSASSTYHIDSTSTLVIATGTEEVLRDGITYTRWISIENVNRSATSGAITLTGGSEDPSTQKVTTYIEWAFFGDTTRVSLTQYLTRWSRNTATVFTDWSGSSGQDGPITRPDSNYFTSSGDINLSTTIQTGSSGYLISSTFDTGYPDGMKINAILWQGALGVGGTNSVKFQIASSNSSGGPWTFIGSDGTSNTFYVPSGPGTSYPIPVGQHNNKRYFRYKVQLDKDGASTSPVVEDIIINWSP